MENLEQIKKGHTGKQISFNLFSQILSFFSDMIVGVMLAPFLIKNIGVASFGLVSIAISFTKYIGIITTSFNSAVGRFLSVEYLSENKKEAQKTYSSAFFTILGLVIFQVFLAFIIITWLEYFVVIPEGTSTQTKWLFSLSFFAFFITLFSSLLKVPAFVGNRIDLLRFTDASTNLLKFFLIVALFYIFLPNLIFVGIAISVAACVNIVIAFSIKKKLMPDISISKNNFSFEKAKEIGGFSSWVIVNQIGSLLFLSVDVYLINLLVSPDASGEYAAILQWVILFRTFAGIFSSTFHPTTYRMVAEQKKEKLISILKLATKSIGLLIGIGAGIVCGGSKQLLTLWLGENFSYLWPLMILMIAPLTVNLSVLPLFALSPAYKKVKAPAIVTLSMGIFSALLGIILMKFFDFGLYGMAFASLIALTFKNFVFTPVYASKILQIKTFNFYPSILLSIVSLVISGSFSWILFNNLNISSIYLLFAVFALLGLGLVLVIFRTFVSKKEKQTVFQYLPQKFDFLERFF